MRVCVLEQRGNSLKAPPGNVLRSHGCKTSYCRCERENHDTRRRWNTRAYIQGTIEEPERHKSGEPRVENFTSALDEKTIFDSTNFTYITVLLTFATETWNLISFSSW